MDKMEIEKIAAEHLCRELYSYKYSGIPADKFTEKYMRDEWVNNKVNSCTLEELITELTAHFEQRQGELVREMTSYLNDWSERYKSIETNKNNVLTVRTNGNGWRN